jgi:hypothetical protein
VRTTFYSIAVSKWRKETTSLRLTSNYDTEYYALRIEGNTKNLLEFVCSKILKRIGLHTHGLNPKFYDYKQNNCPFIFLRISCLSLRQTAKGSWVSYCENRTICCFNRSRSWGSILPPFYCFYFIGLACGIVREITWCHTFQQHGIDSWDPHSLYMYSKVVTQKDKLTTRLNQGDHTGMALPSFSFWCCVLSWQTCLVIIGQSSREQRYHVLVQAACCQLRQRLWGVQLWYDMGSHEKSV